MFLHLGGPKFPQPAPALGFSPRHFWEAKALFLLLLLTIPKTAVCKPSAAPQLESTPNFISSKQQLG